MEHRICLTKEDIQTFTNGNHFEIRTNGVVINLSPDAVDEFIKDIEEIRTIQKPKQISVVELKFNTDKFTEEKNIMIAALKDFESSLSKINDLSVTLNINWVPTLINIK